MPKKKAEAAEVSPHTRHAVEQTGNPGEPEVYWFSPTARKRYEAKKK